MILTFEPNGRVTKVEIDPPFQGTVAGVCIANKYGAVTVPPFDGGPVRVGKSFYLEPTR